MINRKDDYAHSYTQYERKRRRSKENRLSKNEPVLRKKNGIWYLMCRMEDL